MKSNADQRRIAAWLASASSSQERTSGDPHAATRAATSASSKATCAGIQNRRREMPPRPGMISSGRRGQAGSTTLTS